MPTRFDSVEPREIRRTLISREQFEPVLFIGGDPIAGFFASSTPPDMGFFGVTFRSKQINAATIEPGNAATFIMNTVVDPFTPGDQRFVSLGAGMLMRQAFNDRAEPVSMLKALSNRLSPVQNIADLNRRLQFVDEDFNAEEATAEFVASSPSLVQIAERRGIDLPNLLRGSRNIEHFQYLKNRSLLHAQALGEISQFEEQAGMVKFATSRLLSGVGNYLLTDPTFLPSLFIGPGTLNAAGKAIKIGSKLANLTYPILGLDKALRVGVIASAILKSPAALHAGLATHLGHRGAVAVELGIHGGLWDSAFQNERINQSLVLSDDPNYQQHFSWAELGLAVGIGSTLGYVLGGGRGASKSMTRKAHVEIAGGDISSSPLAHSFDNIKAQGRLDQSAINVQRAASRIIGDDFDVVAPFIDDIALNRAGLTKFDVEVALNQVADAIGDRQLPANAVVRILDDLFEEAERFRGLLTKTELEIGGEIERRAFANAMGRAARELPDDVSNERVVARAAQLMPEELDEVIRRAQPARSTPATEGELPYWKAEADMLRDAASKRSLTDEELTHLIAIDRKLVSLGEDSILKGMSRDRAARYTDGRIFSPLRMRGGSDLSKVVNKAAKDRRLIRELEATPRTDATKKELKNARDRVRRADKKIEKLADEVGSGRETAELSTIKQVQEKWKGKPPETRSEKFQALDDIAAAKDFDLNTLIEDQGALGKILNGWGVGRAFRRIATTATGQEFGMRSSLGVLREIASEMDNSKLRVHQLSLDARPGRTATDIRMDMERKITLLTDEYDRLRLKGKFGKLSLFAKRRDFDRDVLLHAAGKVKSKDPDIIRVADIWRKMADEIGEVGEATGLFKRLDNFVPRRINVGKVMKDQAGFRTALSNFFLKRWQGSDEVHLDTLVSLGKAKRVINDQGDIRGWDLGDGKVITSLKRSQLDDEAGYLRAMNTPDADGFTPMQSSAQRAMNNMLGENSFETSQAGKLVIKRRGQPASNFERQLSSDILTDEDLSKFMDFRFIDIAADYLKSTGFRVMNNARHSERWGIPNLTMHDTLDWLDSRILKFQKEAGAEADELRKWRAGLKDLRQKVLLMEGRLPTIREHIDGLGEWVSETGQALAGAIYGGGIGQAILSTEMMQALLSRIHSPVDIVRTVVSSFKLANPLTHRATVRHQLQTLGIGSRVMRHDNLERLTGGALHSSFQFGILPKMLAPFRDFWELLAGRTAPHSGSALSGRSAAIPAAIRAQAAMNMQVGGMDFFTTFARVLHVQSISDETGRFWQAAEKMSAALKGSSKELNNIERLAREAALEAGKTSEKALKAGQVARFKAWKGIARESGFSGLLGGNQWQVAERMSRFGLLDPEMLAVLRRAGDQTRGLKAEGMMRTLDLSELQRYQPATKAESDLFDEAFKRLRDMFENTIHKRVSEQNILQTPTGDASRTWLGKIQLSMTSFARSWFDNNLMDTAQMPLRPAIGLLTAFLVGETLNRLVRELWRGRTIDDIAQDIEDDPDNFVARTMTNIPILGAYSPLLRAAGDALTKNDRRFRYQTGESAAEGAFESASNLLLDSVHGVSPFAEDAEFERNTLKTAARFIPGYKSWWAMMLAEGIKGTTGVDIVAPIEGGSRRRRSIPTVRVDIPKVPLDITEVRTDPISLPEDISFLYPE